MYSAQLKSYTNTCRLILAGTICFLMLVCTLSAQSPDQKPRDQAIQLSCSIAYLPSFHNESEAYHVKGRRVRHTYCKQKQFIGLRWHSCKPLLRSNKQMVLQAVDYIEQKADDRRCTIILTEADMDSLIALSKKKDYLGNLLYRVEYADIIRQIDSNRSITIEYNQFNTAYSQALDKSTTVIDGAPFFISLTLISKNQDTVVYDYSGNLYDGVPDTQVDEFMTYYMLYQQSPLFSQLPMEAYFSKETLYKILLRYIAYAEYKINRENYFDLDNP